MPIDTNQHKGCHNGCGYCRVDDGPPDPLVLSGHDKKQHPHHQSKDHLNENPADQLADQEPDAFPGFVDYRVIASMPPHHFDYEESGCSERKRNANKPKHRTLQTRSATLTAAHSESVKRKDKFPNVRRSEGSFVVAHAIYDPKRQPWSSA